MKENSGPNYQLSREKTRANIPIVLGGEINICAQEHDTLTRPVLEPTPLGPEATPFTIKLLCLFFLYNITPVSHIKVMRIKEMITN